MSGGFDDRGGSPSRFGASATREIDPRAAGRLSIVYNPVTDGDADPGEIVWTWVPYQERDGRGKDRPVLVIATEPGGTVLAVQLTSKPHDDQWDVAIGSGAWDSAGRPSWVRLERVFRVHQAGMRREAVALDATRFGAVAAALSARFGWRVAPTAPSPARSAGPVPAASAAAPAPPTAGRARAAGDAASSRPRSGLVRAFRRLFGSR